MASVSPPNHFGHAAVSNNTPIISTSCHGPYNASPTPPSTTCDTFPDLASSPPPHSDAEPSDVSPPPYAHHDAQRPLTTDAYTVVEIDSQGAPLTAIDLQHFTTAGRPMACSASATAVRSLSWDIYAAPNLLPVRFTDESIIPAVVCGVVRSTNDAVVRTKSAPAPRGSGSDVDGDHARRQSTVEGAGPVTRERRGSRNPFRKLMGRSLNPSAARDVEDITSTKPPKSRRRKDGPVLITKVVFMPRADYLRYFARDTNGDYAGTEPQRVWTEDELEARYAECRPARLKR